MSRKKKEKLNCSGQNEARSWAVGRVGLEENEKLDGFGEENRRVFPSQKGENIGWQFARPIIGNLQV